MQPVVGRTFRNPQHKRPWWQQALTGLGILLLTAYLVAIASQTGALVWNVYRRFPPYLQQSGGRLAALAAGLSLFSAGIARWRQKIYLAPAMRDLASTPAKPWQLLRLNL